MSAEVASDRLAPVQKGWGWSPPRQHTLRELVLLEGRFWARLWDSGADMVAMAKYKEKRMVPMPRKTR